MNESTVFGAAFLAEVDGVRGSLANTPWQQVRYISPADGDYRFWLE